MIRKQIAVFFVTLMLVLGLVQVDRVCSRIYAQESMSDEVTAYITDIIKREIVQYLRS